MSDYQPTPPPSAPYATPGYGAPVQKSPILSILALIFGIVGLLGSIFAFGFGILPSIAAVVLGFLGRRKEPLAKGLWLTGIILGFVGIAAAIIVWVVVGLIFAAAAAHGTYSN